MVALQTLLRPAGESVGDLLKSEFLSGRWSMFRAGVAFAKMSGVKHLDGPLRSFVGAGGRCMLAVGIDHGGTSFEGLSQLLGAIHGGGELHIAHQFDPTVTFHPKVYVFSDDQSSPARALVVVGSANLTEGGLYSNHEASLAWEPALSGDSQARAVLDEILEDLARWSSPTSGLSIRANGKVLLDLHGCGKLPTEQQIASSLRKTGATQKNRSSASQAPFPAGLKRQPKTAVPPVGPLGLPAVRLSTEGPTSGAREGRTRGGSSTGGPQRSGAPSNTRHRPIHRTLVVDINQKQRTECYLAKAPVDEDPGFFGWPWMFRSRTRPKGSTGVAQPQRYPWPWVELVLLDSTGTRRYHDPKFSLKMDRHVYPRQKGGGDSQDVRLGVPAELLRSLPRGCLLRMQRGPTTGLAYRLEFLSPGSTEWSRARAIATNPLPNSTRRYGWV
jgi:HKD family nuclease